MLSAAPTPAQRVPLQPAKNSLDLLPASLTCYFRSRRQQLFLQIKAQSAHVEPRTLSPPEVVAGKSSPDPPKRPALKRPHPRKARPLDKPLPQEVVAKPEIEASIFKVISFRPMHLKLDSWKGQSPLTKICKNELGDSYAGFLQQELAKLRSKMACSHSSRCCLAAGVVLFKAVGSSTSTTFLRPQEQQSQSRVKDRDHRPTS